MEETPNDRLRAVFHRALSKPVVGAPARHPADVTADRLVGHAEKWHHLMDGSEKDAFGLVVHVLREIAEGTRG